MYYNLKGQLLYILVGLSIIAIFGLSNTVYADNTIIDYDYPMIFDRWEDLDPDQNIELYTDKTDSDRFITPDATRIKFKFSKKLFINSNLQIIEKSTGKIVAESSIGETDLEARVVFPENTLSEGKRYVVDRKIGIYSRIQAEFIVSGGFVEKPIFDPILDSDLKVTGHGLINTVVHLRVGPEDYEAPVNEDGSFIVELNNTYEEDTVITGFLVDKEGIESERVKVVVQASSILPPIINPIIYKDTVITGFGKPNTKILVTFDDGSLYESVVNLEGKYSIQLKNNFPIGTKVEAYLQSTTVPDVVSEKTHSEVLERIITLSVNAVESFDDIVTGRTIPNALITVEIGDATGKKYTSIADSKGNFSVSMENHTYISGTKVSIMSSVGDNVIDKLNVIVYPSKPIVEQPTEGDNFIKGNVDSNATVYIEIDEELYVGKANENGEFSVNVHSLSKGMIIRLKQISQNISSSIRVVEV